MSSERQEVPCFLQVGGERLFAVLHSPPGTPRGGFVFCHPLAEEKLWSHRVLVSFARRLTLSGWRVLRIDFRGEGDSERSFDTTDVRTRIEDTRTALAVLRADLPGSAPVGLLGLRFGAAIAAWVASAENSGVNRLILWDPVIEGAPYMQTVLMTNLAFQMAVHRRVVEDRKTLVGRLRSGASVNIEGYPLSLQLFEEASALNLGDTLDRFSGRGLVVQIGPSAAPVKKDLYEVVARCKSLELARAEEEPFWKEIKTFYQRADRLAAVTLNWIEDTA